VIFTSSYASSLSSPKGYLIKETSAKRSRTSIREAWIPNGRQIWTPRHYLPRLYATACGVVGVVGKLPHLDLEFGVRARRTIALSVARAGQTTPRSVRESASTSATPARNKRNVLRPCLVHGDLCEGSAGVQAKNGLPCFFDASALWAHNEYEMHAWRSAQYRVGRTFVKEYFRHSPVSPPEEDWDDRNQLYSLLSKIHDSTLYPHSEKLRELLVGATRALVEKFPNGYEGTAERKKG